MCSLSEYSWLHCLGKPVFTFCAYFWWHSLIDFLFCQVFPSFINLTKAPSQSERKREGGGGIGEKRRNEDIRKVERNWRILCDIANGFLKRVCVCVCKGGGWRGCVVARFRVGNDHGKLMEKEKGWYCKSQTKAAKRQGFLDSKHMVYPKIID